MQLQKRIIRQAAEAPTAEESRLLNRSLSAAKASKQDEFYTHYVDIQKEDEAYLEFDPRHLPQQDPFVNRESTTEAQQGQQGAAPGQSNALEGVTFGGASRIR